MQRRIYLLIFIVTLSAPVFGEKIPAPKKDSLVVIGLKDIDRIEKLLQRGEPSWFTTYGTMVVAIIALIGAVLTSTLNNRRSWLNTKTQVDANNANLTRQLNESSTNLTRQLEANNANMKKQLDASYESVTRQLDVSQKNLEAQIKASQNQEIEKKRLELVYKMKSELKETAAKFITRGSDLNITLSTIIERASDGQGATKAKAEYGETLGLRQELAELYYFIKITLDSSSTHFEVEEALENYMAATCGTFDPNNTSADDYRKPFQQFYRSIKAVIHENYDVQHKEGEPL